MLETGICNIKSLFEKLTKILINSSDNRRRYNTATYENVRDAGKANNVWIIDVRDRRDISRTGAIKNAINIPCKI